jgi:YidC/Oxa1 family membrane protein insertase
MEKRVILAIALSAIVFIAFTLYQRKNLDQAGFNPPAVQSPIQEPEKPALPSTPKAAPAAKPKAAPAAAHDTKASAQKIVIAGKQYRAVIDNQGAVIASWELNDFKSVHVEDKSWFQYILDAFSSGANKDKAKVFEMIWGSQGSDALAPSLPASLIFSDDSLTKLANKEFYEISVEGGAVTGEILSAPATVILKLRRDDLIIEKRFRFEKDKYLIDLSISCEKDKKALDGDFFLGEDLGSADEHLLNSAALEAVYDSGGKVQRETPPKTEDGKRFGGDVRWAGLNMQYFAVIAIPDRPLPYFTIKKQAIKSVDGKEVKRNLLRVTTPINGSMKYQLYLGPKRQSDLEAVESADITGVVNNGYFWFLVQPLMASLRWIFKYAHNYGFAIIILTFLLSLALFPFRLKQIVSMKKMQVVQPKVKAIQEKYRKYKKTDPKRTEMNQEVMALYKEHGVNPLGGCIPLLLQMPLLWAFYSLLQNSIELRHAPFILWIPDLSVKDPTLILPIVMGITMFISQKMTPMAPGADPTQAKMMMLMPIVFTFMFVGLSSGLNLYFLCSNIFQIAFQKIAERWIGGGTSGKKAKS